MTRSRARSGAAAAVCAVAVVGGRAAAQEADVTLFAHPGEPGASHGAALAALANADGAGAHALAIGAPRETGAAGAVEVRALATGALLWRASGTSAGDRFGTALADAGDLDGDAAHEVWVGAPGGAGQVVAVGAAGVVRVFDGAQLGFGPGTDLGRALAVPGDLDGDGLDDLVVGVPGGDLGSGPAGAAVACSGLDGAVLWAVGGSAFLDRAGTALAAAGDVDGDGVGDVAVGVPLADGAGSGPGGGFNAGAVELRSGRDGSLLWRTTGAAAGDRLGERLASVGDVDGDGRREVLAGAPGADLAGFDSGGAWLLSGADGTPLLEVPGFGPGEFGAAVCGVGDVDGDGGADLAFGSESAGGGGRVRVVSGASGAVLTTLDGEAVDAWFGAALADVGDVNGDGAPELAVGAPGDEDLPGAVGVAHVLSTRTLALWSDGHALEPGDTQELEAEFEGLGGAAYLVLGSLGGLAAAPGPLSIEPDAYTVLTAQGAAPLEAGAGLLDPAGRARIRFQVPPAVASAAPFGVHHLCVVFGPAGPAASAPVAAWIDGPPTP